VIFAAVVSSGSAVESIVFGLDSPYVEDNSFLFVYARIILFTSPYIELVLRCCSRAQTRQS